MTVLEPRRTNPTWCSPSAVRSMAEIEPAWRNDVALEMWIDVTSAVVVIRLEGVLDDATGANLVDVVRQCMAEDKWDFELDIGSLRIAESGWAVMDRMREQVQAAGGHLRWVPDSVA